MDKEIATMTEEERQKQQDEANRILYGMSDVPKDDNFMSLSSINKNTQTNSGTQNNDQSNDKSQTAEDFSARLERL